jgi:hypothetical protein
MTANVPNETPAAAERTSGIAIRLWLALAVAIVAILAANAHLLYVAISSQPDCVTHVMQGEGSTEPGRFSAAQSSCAPPPARAGQS